MGFPRSSRPWILTLTSFVLVCSPMDTFAMLLSGAFNEVSSEGRFLEVYRTKAGADSIAWCSMHCLREKAATPTCLAFSYNPLDKTCDFYTVSTAQVPSPGTQVYLLKITDTFHSISIGGRTFSILLSSQEKTFLEARAHCNSLGGYLIQFDSLEEYQAVALVLSGQSPGSTYVGANDMATEGAWVTDKDGVPLISDGVWSWNPGEPNNSYGEDCGMIIFNVWLLNDTLCGKALRFLCEKDA